jgi:hypothetical protein
VILVHILVLVSAPQLDSEETRIRRLEQRQSESALDIEYLNTEEGVQVDLHAKRVPFSSVVKKVASDLGYTVAGLDRLQRDPYVDSRLSNRSLPSAMAWIAGSAGLHVRIWGTSIDVTEEIPINPRREDLYLLAQSALGRALADHPDSSQAPRAQWIRAEMESELPDRDWECALAFDDLVEGYPDSDLVPAAMLEAGKHYGRHGRWDLAIDRFDKLAAYRTPHPLRRRDTTSPGRGAHAPR